MTKHHMIKAECAQAKTVQSDIVG